MLKNAGKQDNKKITVSEEPMSIEEQIRFHIKSKFSLAIHGKQGTLEKVLVHFPYHFMLEMNNEMKPEDIIGQQHYDDNSHESIMTPPNWYSEFCIYCKEYTKHDCVLLIHGITKCEPSKQVLLNNLILERKLRVDHWPLPANSSIILLVENKEDANYIFYNITEQVFRRLEHIYLDN